MAALIAHYPDAILANRGDPFQTLARAIVGQQISVKAADSVWARFADYAQTISPEHVATLELDALAACGLSRRKAEYLRDLAGHFVDGRVEPARWKKMDDEAVIAELDRRARYRPLDGRDVPDLQPAPPRRLAGRRHRAAESRRLALSQRRTPHAENAAPARRAPRALAHGRHLVSVAQSRSGGGAVLDCCAQDSLGHVKAINPNRLRVPARPHADGRVSLRWRYGRDPSRRRNPPPPGRSWRTVPPAAG